MSENRTFLGVTEGKRKREELTLPALHFAVADAHTVSWIDVLGPKAFTAWLKLFTLVDRTDQALEEYHNKQTVPYSIEKLAVDVFKTTKPTFYKNVIKPLWNHGLIDIVEWKNHAKIGQKAMNIIVYHYPQNNKILETKPLEKVRDYDKDYQSDGKTYGQMGGYVRKVNAIASDRLENLTVRGIKLSYINADLANRLKTLTVTVKDSKRTTVKKSKPINSSNTQVNSSNTQVNNPNSSLKRIDDDEKIYNKYLGIIQNNSDFKELAQYLNGVQLDLDLVQNIVVELHAANIPFSKKAVVQQLEYMLEKSQKEKISNFVRYFVNGMINRADTYHAEEQYEENYETYMTSKLSFSKKLAPEVVSDSENTRNVYYNWLEE